MPNVNTILRYVRGSPVNPELVDLTEPFLRRDNAEFLAEVRTRLSEAAADPVTGAYFDAGGIGCIGLLGEFGLIGYGIRRALEVLRVDHTPSYWSHAFLLAQPLSADAKANRDPRNSPWIWESTLEPATAFNRFTDRNGVGPRRIGEYSRARFDPFAAHSCPNVAIIAIGLTRDERTAILDRADDPDVDQLHYDILGLLGTWYAYLTNRANQPNPLAQGHAVYCSAFVQLAYDAAGIDLAPGAHERNTSPEHLWQTVKFFHERLPPIVIDGARTARPVRGWYCVRDPYCQIAPPLARLEHARPFRLSELTQRLDAERI